MVSVLGENLALYFKPWFFGLLTLVAKDTRQEQLENKLNFEETSHGLYAHLWFVKQTIA